MKTNKIRYIAFVIVTLIIIVTLTGCNYETEDSFEKVTTIATEKMEPILIDPLTELYEELDYAFIPICFETVFRNKKINIGVVL